MAIRDGVAQGKSRENQARAAGLDPTRPVTLRDVDRRRTQIWSAAFFTVLGVVAIVVLYWAAYDLLPEPLRFAGSSTYFVAVLIVGLVLALALYAIDKERRLRALTRMLVEERHAVARLEELDRLKSDFVATVSHELRTPLTAIIGAAKTVGRRAGGMDPTHQAEFVTMIERQGDRLLRLVEDVLTTAQIEAGRTRMKREIVDLKALADEVVADLGQTERGLNRSVIVESDPPRPRTWADLVALEHVLSNLVENALKYAPPPARITVRVIETVDEARMEVHDEGPGITPDKLEAIFERFRQIDSSSTRRAGGFGLGLFIVKNLVDAHGGRIDVTSRAGEGTTFTVHLPKRASDRGRFIEPTTN